MYIKLDNLVDIKNYKKKLITSLQIYTYQKINLYKYIKNIIVQII